MDREELLERAEELEIKVEDDAKDSDIQSLIKDKEEELEKEKNENDVEYLRNELKKVIKQRDTAKTDRRTLQKKIKTLEESVKGMPKSEELTALKKELTTLKEFKATLDREKEEKDLENADELQKVELRYKKEVNGFQLQLDALKKTLEETNREKEKAIEEKEKESEILRESILEAQIIKAANKHGAISSDQVVRLIKNDFTFEKDLEKFVHHVRDGKKLLEELTVDEHVAAFLGKEENDNLVKSKVENKSLHTKGTLAPKSTTTTFTTKKTKDYNPKDETLIKEADFAGMSVEDWIDIKIIKDEKLGKIRSKNND